MRAKITAEHLERAALVYVRQSTPGQVRDHTESQRRQYALADVARELGFHRVETIDDDLGISGSGFAERPGFQRLLTTVCSGTAGAVLALEASRLARNDRDWSQLVELGAITKVVLIDHDGIYDPRLVNDRLLLGLKGIMSDFEMATLRQRALEAQRAKAQRGELWMHLPVGLVYGPTGAIELDPDIRVQQAIRLVLQKFDELGSTRQVLLWLRRERISVPVTRQAQGTRHTEWAPANYTRVHGIVTNPFLAGTYVYGRQVGKGKLDENYCTCEPRDGIGGGVLCRPFQRFRSVSERNRVFCSLFRSGGGCGRSEDLVTPLGVIPAPAAVRFDSSNLGWRITRVVTTAPQDAHVLKYQIRAL